MPQEDGTIRNANDIPPKRKPLRTPSTERQELADAIKTFLAEKVSASEFREKLEESFFRAHDPLITFSVESLLQWVEECDGTANFRSKDEWDYLQRLLIALETNCRVDVKICFNWSIRQVPAVISTLSLLLAFVIVPGSEVYLLLLPLPCSLILLALGQFSQFVARDIEPRNSRIAPFASDADLARACGHSAHGTRVIPDMAHVNSNMPMKSSNQSRLLAFVIWFCYSPFLLLKECLPEWDRCIKVRAA